MAFVLLFLKMNDVSGHFKIYIVFLMLSKKDCKDKYLSLKYIY